MAEISGGLARFYEAAGYRVLPTSGACWFNASERVYHSLPLSCPVDPPDTREIERLLRHEGLVGVQYTTRRSGGVPCCVFTVRDKDYGEQSLHRTFRQNLRRGRRRCSVRALGFDELERVGVCVNHAAMAGRPYRDPRFTDPASWRRFCVAGRQSDGAGALGAFVDGELAGYLLYFIEQGASHGLHLMARRDWRVHRFNHLLYFEFTRRMMSRGDVEVVNTGAQSVPANASLDRFKRHAGYRAEPCRLAVALHPLARAALCNPASRALLAAGRRAFPGSPGITRVGAVVRMASATASVSP